LPFDATALGSTLINSPEEVTAATISGTARLEAADGEAAELGLVTALAATGLMERLQESGGNGGEGVSDRRGWPERRWLRFESERRRSASSEKVHSGGADRRR
jgi:hypothetical protein